jgi:DNA-directed RNA polymerase specialized sigma24 family protein
MAAASGDRGAWDALVERHAQDVWATARSRGLGVDEAADVSVLAWLRLADRLDDFTSDIEVWPWLRAVATREADRVVRHGAPRGAAALSVAIGR